MSAAKCPVVTAPREAVDGYQTPSPVALLLIDVINGFAFDGCEGLVQAAEAAAPRILALRERARAAGVPILYVNDNFGRWRSDFRSTVAACAEPNQPGHRVTRLLSPEPNDYFVLKPRHSGFYGTALELLLDRLEAQTLVLVGFATNICVLFTANDAHMRGYDVIVPSDCTASNSPALTEQALEQLRLVAAAQTEESSQLDLRDLVERPRAAYRSR
jgi:nicotinamidase-related amidase